MEGAFFEYEQLGMGGSDRCDIECPLELGNCRGIKLVGYTTTEGRSSQRLELS